MPAMPANINIRLNILLPWGVIFWFTQLKESNETLRKDAVALQVMAKLPQKPGTRH
jgi:hypothetical protein